MASALSFPAAKSFNIRSDSAAVFHLKIHRTSGQTFRYAIRRPRSLEVKAAEKNSSSSSSSQSPKPRSVICTDCDGNGAVICSQCKGAGINQVDIFNGQFKAGAPCWICGGKKEMLCGNCNGAGFIGGFMSTFDE